MGRCRSRDLIRGLATREKRLNNKLRRRWIANTAAKDAAALGAISAGFLV